MTNLSRRALLGGTLFQKLHHQNIAINSKVIRTVPRPPTAVDEDIFKRLCTQCGQCKTVCPEHVIIFKDGYPVINIEYSACTLCFKCKAVCPTNALSNLLNDTGLRVHITNTCINEYVYCNECETSCPVSALQWQDKQIPTIDHDKCIGCGLCKNDCYIEAITMQEETMCSDNNESKFL